jgi:alpha-D-ribose 1-methylphosphonate 5-triphosphate diphosphatase
MVLPGFVDLHNDALEAEINPRPGAGLPLAIALAVLDRRLAASGVTTEFNALFFADMARNERKLTAAPERAAAVLTHGGSSQALVAHHVLFRVDVWSRDSLETALLASEGAAVRLLSLNDHTPGQGQYRDLDQFKRYYLEKLGRTNEIVESEISFQIERAATKPEIAAGVFRRVRDLAGSGGLIVMSHDDDSPEKVDLVYDVGARIGEFPVTVEAAARQRELGMTITAGAPNVVRGGSASGNISAWTLLEHGYVDALCADYHAPSLLLAVLEIVHRDLMTLPEAVRLITLNPARAVGVDSTIGSLEPGKLADIAVVDLDGSVPVVEMTLRSGQLMHFARSGRAAPEDSSLLPLATA